MPSDWKQQRGVKGYFFKKCHKHKETLRYGVQEKTGGGGGRRRGCANVRAMEDSAYDDWIGCSENQAAEGKSKSPEEG